jgi:hypothetical protein
MDSHDFTVRTEFMYNDFLRHPDFMSQGIMIKDMQATFSLPERTIISRQQFLIAFPRALSAFMIRLLPVFHLLGNTGKKEHAKF